MKNKTKKIFSTILILTLVFMNSGILNIDVQAATKKVKSIKLSTSTKTLYVSGPKVLKTTTIEAKISPSNASNKKIKWTTSDKKIATVNSKGKVTAKSPGKVTITATSKDSSKVYKTIKLTVNKKYTAITKLKITAGKQSLGSGASTKIAAVVSPKTATNAKVTYKSMNKALATVNANGTVTANNNGKTGTVKIKVTTKGLNKNSVKLVKYVTITIKPVTVTRVSMSTSRTLLRGQSSKIIGTVYPLNSTNKTVTYKSANSGIASVTSAGMVTAKALGTTTITCTSANGKTASCKVIVENISIHDPSVVQDKDGSYYLFGTHLGAAKSNDLINWTSIGGTGLFKNGMSSLNSIHTWINDTVTFMNVWASDVIYNETMKKYCYYASSSVLGSTNSVIWFATSDSITGPFSNPKAIAYSGFTNNTSGTFSYTKTNIKQLIDNGTISGFKSDWASGTNYNCSEGKYPNAIDPALFYDADGKLWMTYGSWSGGIYILEIDQNTGVPIYPGTDDTANGVDRYFGRMLTTSAGNDGNGEGPFIMYDSVSEYYYLYVTYGGFGALDGYNIRVFRSKNPDGPYEDAAGILGTEAVNKGTKLFGNYKFTGMSQAYLSGGHSSAFVDKNGKMYQIYHTRFADGVGGGHQVRVHQMYVNEAGWTVVFPHEYTGETVNKAGYSTSDIVGTYEFINHGNATVTTDNMSNVSSIIETTSMISLSSNGKISGDYTGTWEVTSNSPYITLTVNGMTYRGVLCKQKDETSNHSTVMTFSAIGSDNKSVWGSKVTLTDSKAVTSTISSLNTLLSSNVRENLPTEGFEKSTITWTSSNTSVISNTGVVTRKSTDQTVTLTAKVKKNNIEQTKTFTVTVKNNSFAQVDSLGLIAKYTFDESGDLGGDSSGNTANNATVNGSAYTSSYNGRTGVLKFDGIDDYIKLPKAVTNAEEFTFAAWVYVDSSTGMWSRIFDMGDSAGNSIFLTVYSGYSNLRLASAVNSIEKTIDGSSFSRISGKWIHLAVIIDSNKKATLYYNGEAYGTTFYVERLLNDYTGNYSYLGKSQYSTDPYFKGYMDDVSFYGKALTAQEIADLNN